MSENSPKVTNNSNMDAEKDKPIPEKSSSFVSRDNAKNETNDNIVKDTLNEHDPDQDRPKEEENKNVKAPETPEDTESKPEKNDMRETEIKEEEACEIKAEESTEMKDEESFALPPDLNKVSEEIDQYISTLSSSKRDESTPPDVPISVEQFAVLLEAKVEDYDSNDCPVKWTRLTEEDSVSFLEAIDRASRLAKSLSDFSSEYKYAHSINRIGGVLQRAMLYMEDEFKSLIEDYQFPDADSNATNNNNNNDESKSKQSTSTNSDPEGEQNVPPEPEPVKEDNSLGYSGETTSSLIKLSKAMIMGGYEAECCQVYFVARRNALEECMHKLGFEKLSVEDVQKMNWESLEREIITWIKTFKQCATVHLSSERKLSEAVFPDYPSISESLFGSLARGIMIQLLNFSEAVALTKRAAEKLFKFLDIYEALRDIFPTIISSLPGEWMDELKTEASLIRSRLGEAMVSIFSELEHSIRADAGKTPVAGGAVHPLTRYIMNYLEYACEYNDTLEQVFREHKKIDRADSATGSEFDYNSQQSQYPNNEVVRKSPLQTQIMKLMELLDANLDAKSKLYKDPSLSLIFMMNNGRYILQKIRGSSEINSLMDDTWCRRRSSDLRQYHKNYQRETWGKLLNCLNPEGLNVNGKVVKPVLKEKFKSFNAMFDEIHKTQSTWVVSDDQLQSELRVSISNMVIPAYRSFLGRFSQTFTPGRQTEKYVKYQPEDIETAIDELFDGNVATMGRKRM